jgi:hypothetical protein
MANLKQAGTQRLAKLGRRPDLPPWWRGLSYVLLAGFFVYLGVVGLRSETIAPLSPETLAALRQEPGAAAPTPLPPSPVAPDPVTPEPVEPGVPLTPQPEQGGGAGAGAESDPGQAAGDIVVATVQGGSTSVPAAAHAVARAAALALFTGTFDQVPLAGAASVPTGLPTYAAPVAGATLLELADGERLVFSTVVDPDGPGPEVARPVTVSVVTEGGVWRFVGFGF